MFGGGFQPGWPRSDLVALSDDIASQKHLCKDKLASFKGRLLIATNHVFGRCAQVCTQLIGQALRARDGASVFQEVAKAAKEALHMLRQSGPRQITAWGGEPPVLIFADGACEDEGRLVMRGAVMFDLATGCQEFFWRQSARLAGHQVETDGSQAVDFLC